MDSVKNEKALRIARLIVAALAYAGFLFVALRFFLGFDVTPRQLIFASLVVVGSFAGLVSYLIRIVMPSTVTLPLGGGALLSNIPFQIRIDERMRRLLSSVTGIVVLVISAMLDPAGTYARSSSRAAITVYYITDRQPAQSTPLHILEFAWRRCPTDIW